MKVTVILCTYNRSASLAKALESLAAMKVPAEVDWRVLVVDNNSKDDTRQVVESFCRREPGHFAYLFEPKQGKSNALNSGIAQAEGEILAFTDDDLTVEPDWLDQLTKPFSDPQWAGTGGRVLLEQSFHPPAWLGLSGPSSIGGILAYFDPGNEPRAFDVPPVGANMAYRREMFSKYGGFRTDLGPCPGRAVRYEDTEFGSRLLKGGDRIRYVPTAVVRHEVRPERVRQEYFLNYFYGYGRAVIREREKSPAVWFIPGSVVSLGNRLLNLLPKRISWWLRESDERKRFHNKCYVWMTAGEIVELCSFSEKPGTDSWKPEPVKPS